MLFIVVEPGTRTAPHGAGGGAHFARGLDIGPKRQRDGGNAHPLGFGYFRSGLALADEADPVAVAANQQVAIGFGMKQIDFAAYTQCWVEALGILGAKGAAGGPFYHAGFGGAAQGAPGAARHRRRAAVGIKQIHVVRTTKLHRPGIHLARVAEAHGFDGAVYRVAVAVAVAVRNAALYVHHRGTGRRLVVVFVKLAVFVRC